MHVFITFRKDSSDTGKFISKFIKIASVNLKKIKFPLSQIILFYFLCEFF